MRFIAWHVALLSVLPVVVFALIAGIFLSQRALARVQNIHQAIERIMKGDVHERLPVGRGNDSLVKLSVSVNHMLDRLEQLMGEMRDVGNDIAHDLRTPLARVQARLDRTAGLSSSLPVQQGEQLDKMLGQCRRDLEQCFSIITAILRIGEIESGQRRAGFSAMALGPLVADLVDLYEPIAEDRGIAVDVTGDEVTTPIFGDVDLLGEILANLLDNAIKFTRKGGWIRIAVGVRHDDRVFLEVSDTGIGIAAEDRDAVLGRFYRADKSRHIPGSGLGLSLVAAIVRLHNAVLDIESNVTETSSSGTTFRVIFPVFSGQNMTL
nr:HAMP domain-containing sensor histidine kinase [Saccharibacter sp. 17.LH.SD]